MGLEDFERDLAEQRVETHKRKRDQVLDPAGARRSQQTRQRRLHRRQHHHDSEDHAQHPYHKLDSSEHRRSHHKHRHHLDHERVDGQKDLPKLNSTHGTLLQQAHNGTDETMGSLPAIGSSTRQRDTWMQAPSALDVDYVQSAGKHSSPSQFTEASKQDNLAPIHTTVFAGKSAMSHSQSSVNSHEVTYTFGDPGSSWRMMKLRVTYQQAENTGKSLDEVAVERYGDLQAFDDAREEELELDRQERYGKGYVGKSVPSGELFKLRKLGTGAPKSDQVTNIGHDDAEDIPTQQQIMALSTTGTLDQTALNKLKARAMKAKSRQASDAENFELEYQHALSQRSDSSKNDVVSLNRMESRLISGVHSGEFKSIYTKRGRERQLFQENEDMSVEDMVRNERRTRGQTGGEAKAFAERIAKDAKFDNDLDYLDENAIKLAKTGQRSGINLRSTAIGDYQKMQRVLDTCPLCYHEASNRAPQATLVSLAMRTFLTLPTSPEITPYGLCASIVPTQHRLNLLECDDDEWEEIRNFMKSLTRFYWSQIPRLSVVFYENAADEGRKRHASMEAIPLPVDLAADASAFFREAILTTDEEWTQHRKIIDTLAKANDGMGRLAFRRCMVPNLPYFHVWFTLDGGMGHVVENTRRWPKGDLFAREIIGGMLDISPEIIKKQGRWSPGDLDMTRRVEVFRKGWEKWDWTKELVEGT